MAVVNADRTMPRPAGWALVAVMALTVLSTTPCLVCRLLCCEVLPYSRLAGGRDVVGGYELPQAAIQEEDGVLVLTEDTIAEALNEFGPLLVEFYAPVRCWPERVPFWPATTLAS